MSESAVLPYEDTELALETVSEPTEEPPVRARKQRRFFASLRYNGLRYFTLAATFASACGLIRGAMWLGAGRPEATFMLALAGGLLAAAAKTAIDIMNWAETARQANHVERIRAVQRIYQRARTVREHAVLDWRRIHTVLVDHLMGQSQEIRLFRNHDETDRAAEGLFRKALSEDIWIREDGIDAVRRFKSDIAALNYERIRTEPEFLAEFNGRMDTLRHELALAAIGIPLD